jgi:hypothetical protein
LAMAAVLTASRYVRPAAFEAKSQENGEAERLGSRRD